jgi:hypothetical protein
MSCKWIPLRNLSGKPVVSREEAMLSLRLVMDEAFDKIGLRNTRNSERIRWCRLIVSAAQVVASIQKDVELEQLRDEIEALKQ